MIHYPYLCSFLWLCCPCWWFQWRQSEQWKAAANEFCL